MKKDTTCEIEMRNVLDVVKVVEEEGVVEGAVGVGAIQTSNNDFRLEA